MAGVVDLHHEHEAVELRLGQGIGALLLDGVLGREDEEGVRQLVAGPAARHLSLDHRLEQRGLGLGRGPVDLVSEDDVREHRARLEAEAPRRGLGVHVQELGPRDVRGHQVGGELDAVEAEVQGFGEAGDEERLREPRHPLEEAVAAGEQGDEELVDDLILSHDHAVEFGLHARVDVSQAVEVGHWGTFP